MPRDDNWPERCTLMGCPNPGLNGHHHHMSMGHLVTNVCRCEHIDQPGTKRKEKSGS